MLNYKSTMKDMHWNSSRLIFRFVEFLRTRPYTNSYRSKFVGYKSNVTDKYTNKQTNK